MKDGRAFKLDQSRVMVSSRMRECFQRCIYRVGFGVGYISFDVGSETWLVHVFTAWGFWRNGTASWRYVTIYYPWHAVTEFKGKDIGSISRKRCLKRSQNGKIKKEKFIVKGTVPLSSREGLDCTGHPTNFRLTSLHQHTLLRASRESSQNSNSL